MAASTLGGAGGKSVHVAAAPPPAATQRGGGVAAPCAQCAGSRPGGAGAKCAVGAALAVYGKGPAFGWAQPVGAAGSGATAAHPTCCRTDCGRLFVGACSAESRWEGSSAVPGTRACVSSGQRQRTPICVCWCFVGVCPSYAKPITFAVHRMTSVHKSRLTCTWWKWPVPRVRVDHLCRDGTPHTQKTLTWTISLDYQLLRDDHTDSPSEVPDPHQRQRDSGSPSIKHAGRAAVSTSVQ